MESIKFRINAIDKQHRGETYYIKNKYFPFPKVFRNKLKIGETLPPTNSFFFLFLLLRRKEGTFSFILYFK